MRLKNNLICIQIWLINIPKQNKQDKYYKQLWNTRLMQGCVYLLTDGEFFKIGVTRGSIEKRIRKLQTGNPNSIVLVSHYDTDYPFKIESALHARHEHQRINNEWFNLTPSDIKNFKEECKNLNDMFEKIKDNIFL